VLRFCKERGNNRLHARVLQVLAAEQAQQDEVEAATQAAIREKELEAAQTAASYASKHNVSVADGSVAAPGEKRQASWSGGFTLGSKKKKVQGLEHQAPHQVTSTAQWLQITLCPEVFR
jgi:hypothetical protein